MPAQLLLGDGRGPAGRRHRRGRAARCRSPASAGAGRRRPRQRRPGRRADRRPERAAGLSPQPDRRAATSLTLRLEGTALEPRRRRCAGRPSTPADGRRVAPAVRRRQLPVGRATPGSISGWGGATRVDRVEVRWPSGRVDRYNGPRRRRRLSAPRGRPRASAPPRLASLEVSGAWKTTSPLPPSSLFLLVE